MISCQRIIKKIWMAIKKSNLGMNEFVLEKGVQ
jgi:hypothetical protein